MKANNKRGGGDGGGKVTIYTESKIHREPKQRQTCLNMFINTKQLTLPILVCSCPSVMLTQSIFSISLLDFHTLIGWILEAASILSIYINLAFAVF